MVRCPRCRYPLPEYHRYCGHCGYRIGLKNGTQSRIAAWAIPVLLLGLLAVSLWWLLSPAHTPDPTTAAPVRYSIPDQPAQQPIPIDTENGTTIDTIKNSGKNLGLVIVGEVIIEDITGRELVRMLAPIVSGGWVALPRSACIGGHRWYVRTAGGKESVIEEGILLDSDTIGLWRITEASIPGPGLATWDSGTEVSWHPINPGEHPVRLAPGQCQEQGDFVHCADVGGIGGPGLFAQRSRVVGWTFDTGPAGGFFWTGLDGSVLRPELQVSDVYRLTYGDSREEAVSQALALASASDAQRLAALATAFSRKPALAPGSTPPRLRRDRLTGIMESLAARLLDQGQARALTRAVPAELVPVINHAGLALQISRAEEQTGGSEAALAFMATIEDSPLMASEALGGRQRRLYDRRLSELLESGKMERFWKVHVAAAERFPADPAIYLHAVAASVASDDWQTAEELLKERQYSETWRDRVENLSRQIARMKELTQGFVIRFPPGSSRIQTDATINGALSLRFTVDTGASLVTVPTSILDRLDVPVGRFTTRRTVRTAGGSVAALEIVLDAIEIQGQTVHNLNALALDIPEAPGMGLLGMNFLNRFQMDLNTEKGLLHLKPR